MKKIVDTENIPIKLWLDELESGAMEQAVNLANFPFAHSHIAIMADAHVGYGMPIGGVLATEGVVIPNAVGVDIGCGMCSLRTSLPSMDSKQLKEVLGLIRKSIPVGFNHHKKRQSPSLMPEVPKDTGKVEMPVVVSEYKNALSQLGTLGGGNHFVEIQKGSDGFIWIMIHSGSRNLGYKVANFYNKLAQKLNGWHGVQIPRAWQLDFLPVDSSEGRQYLAEMNFCVEFALANRKLMMERVKNALQTVTGTLKFDQFINIAHNYAGFESHFNKDVVVHRKGATRAGKGEIGIIPGSQGTASYLVIGKGNQDSFSSCSHGAGRKMGRKQARQKLDLKEELKKLNAHGVIHALRNKSDLDEAPGAYKDINQVIASQLDLVEVMITLKPLAVMKG